MSFCKYKEPKGRKNAGTISTLSPERGGEEQYKKQKNTHMIGAEPYPKPGDIKGKVSSAEGGIPVKGACVPRLTYLFGIEEYLKIFVTHDMFYPPR